jgi:hypothetical protein
MLSKVLNYLNIFKTTPAKTAEAPYKIEPPKVEPVIAPSPQAEVLKATVEEKIAPEPAAAKPKKTSKPRVKK